MKSMNKYFAVFKGVKLPWLLIAAACLFSVLMTSSELQVATLTADIIDGSQNAINGAKLIRYITAALIVAACTIASTYFERRMEETVTMRVRVKLWHKIMCLPLRYYDADSGEGLISRVTSDASAPASLFTVIVSFIVCVVTTVQGFVQLYDYNEMLANYSLLIIPLTLIFCLLYSILQFKLSVFSTVTISSSLGYLAERVRNFRLVKSAAAEKLEAAKGNATFKRMYVAEFLNWLLVAGYQLSSSLFSILFIVVIFVVGGRLVPAGEVTIGDLTSFYMITGVVSVQLMQFFMNAGSVAGIFGTMKKTAQIMETDSEPSGGVPVPPICSDIVFDHVSFAYTDERDVLRDVSMTIPMGRVTAVIGGNGAGKSTVFKLLARLYEPKDGAIRFGGEDIAQYELTDWRDHFSYVFQNEPLLGGTVRENITYGLDRDVSDEELFAVARKANCYDFVMAKPNGFDEDVGLGGSNFSGGQAQCIAIARAMLRSADYLLLDEATSNLDVMSEAMVTEAMANLMRGKTTVMIAHNYAATRSADHVIVMNDGTVEAEGAPEELLKSSDYYRLFSQTT